MSHQDSDQKLSIEDNKNLGELTAMLELEIGEIPERFRIGTAAAFRTLAIHIALVKCMVSGTEEPAIEFHAPFLVCDD